MCVYECSLFYALCKLRQWYDKMRSGDSFLSISRLTRITLAQLVDAILPILSLLCAYGIGVSVMSARNYGVRRSGSSYEPNVKTKMADGEF